ncbi:hypothetical protein DSO57_1006996 [Entomophthora muscae]|uniref:Uncharacterized protein n=1 Tax=Entomophthora muscae TaxID=34485 RepID=A0ACC2UUH0_9FUNG|nr:hypothetical protein DSO57_1006996 [Entomophthora muscae]
MMPFRIRDLIYNSPHNAKSHFLFLKGPVRGSIIFNQIYLSVKGYKPIKNFDLDIGLHYCYPPLFLHTGLPDGILAISHVSKF